MAKITEQEITQAVNSLSKRTMGDSTEGTLPEIAGKSGPFLAYLEGNHPPTEMTFAAGVQVGYYIANNRK